MRVQLSTFSQSLVAAQDRLGGHGIEPRRDPQSMHVPHRRASCGEHPLLARLWNHGPDLVHSRVYKESVRLQIGSESVVSPADRIQAADQLLVDPRALQQCLVRPCGVAVHALDQNRLVCVGAGIKAVVQFVRHRPECQRDSADGQNVSLHSPAALLRLGRERYQFIDGTDVLADIGRNQREPTVHRVTMAVDQPWQ